MNEYEIKVGKIDYYTWKVGAIILLILILIMLGTKNGAFGTPNQAETNDAYWHMGYSECVQYYNFTSDEMYVLNAYRIKKIEENIQQSYKEVQNDRRI